MADDSFDSLRLSFMQDFLPVGIAMVKRVKRGGASKVIEVFTDSKDPFNELREEGEPEARSFRERLDQVSPGLGNPVMKVTVEVDDASSSDLGTFDEESLNKFLTRIEDRFVAIEECLSDELVDISISEEKE